MVASVVQVDSATASAVTSITNAISGLTLGNMLLVACGYADEVAKGVLLPNPGYQPLLADKVVNGGSLMEMRTWYRKAPIDSSSETVTVQFASNVNKACMHLIEVQDSNRVFEVASTHDASSAAVTWPTVDTVQSRSLVLGVCWAATTDVVPPSGYAEAKETETGASYIKSMQTISKLYTAVGATGNMVGSASPGGSWLTQHIALGLGTSSGGTEQGDIYRGFVF